MNLEKLENEVKAILLEDKKNIKEEMQNLLKSYCSNDWNKYISFDAKKYTRNYVCKNDDFEILIVGWDIGQSSIKHGHSLG